jgi:hypothetical protein
MSRSTQPARRKRARVPVLVVLVILLRTVIFASVVGLAVGLLVHGYDLYAIGSFLSLLLASAAAASVSLTRGALVTTR